MAHVTDDEFDRLMHLRRFIEARLYFARTVVAYEQAGGSDALKEEVIDREHAYLGARRRCQLANQEEIYPMT